MRMVSKRSHSGMTLIEILVVLVLIGIVMGIVGGNYIGQGEKAGSVQARGGALSDDAGRLAGPDHRAGRHP